MANRYWVGTGSWTTSNTANWSTSSGGASGASVPTSTDAVFFDASSGGCTMGSGISALSINCTGYTNTWSGSSSSNILNIYGSCTLSTGMTQNSASTFAFNSTGTLIMAGKSFGYMTVNSGATVTLGSALTVDSQLTLSGGTLNTSASNYSITTAIFSGGGSTARTLTLNGSTLTVTGNGGSFDFSGSNLTFNAGTSTVVISGGSYLYAYLGNKTFNNLSFTNTNTAASLDLNTTIYDGCTVNGTLTFSAPSSTGCRAISFNPYSTYTIATLVAAGASPTQRIIFFSNSSGTKVTFTVSTYTTKQYIDFIDFAAAGASAPWSGTSIGAQNVTSITGSTAKTVYWNLTGSQTWDANGWAASSGGAPATSNFPLIQDTAVFDNAGSATTVALPNPMLLLPTISSLGRTSAMTLNFPTDQTCFGASLSFGSGISFSGGGAGASFNLYNRVSATTITLSGQSWPMGLSSDGLGFSFGSAFTVPYTIGVSGLASGAAPTISTNGYNLTVGSFTISNYSSTTTVNLSSSTITLTPGSASQGFRMLSSVTMSAGTSNIIFAPTAAIQARFTGNGKTYNKVTYGGSTAGDSILFSDANTFAEITSTRTIAGTMTFTASTTTTVSAFTVSGSSGNLITINSSTAGTQATLSKSTGTVSADYLSVKDSAATGGATWYAGSHSTNVSNNTGWLFTNAPSATGNFLLMFS